MIASIAAISAVVPPTADWNAATQVRDGSFGIPRSWPLYRSWIVVLFCLAHSRSSGDNGSGKADSANCGTVSNAVVKIFRAAVTVTPEQSLTSRSAQQSGGGGGTVCYWPVRSK